MVLHVMFYDVLIWLILIWYDWYWLNDLYWNDMIDIDLIWLIFISLILIYIYIWLICVHRWHRSVFVCVKWHLDVNPNYNLLVKKKMWIWNVVHEKVTNELVLQFILIDNAYFVWFYTDFTCVVKVDSHKHGREGQ